MNLDEKNQNGPRINLPVEEKSSLTGGHTWKHTF